MATTRRLFLRGAVLFCGCHLLGSAVPRAWQARGPSRRRITIGGATVRTIDMHAHCYVPDAWPLVKDRKEAAGANPATRGKGPMASDAATIAARLVEMDRQGIDAQAVSLQSSQFHYWAERDLAEQVVRIQNEKLAEICSAHPDRFFAFGSVALQHPDLAAQQLEHAARTLRMRGVMIGANVNGEEISAPKFHLFWRKAEELGTLVFVHPMGFPQGGARLEGPGSLDNTLGNPLDTTVALSHMIFSGFLDAFPGVRILAAHGGGYLPSYIGRSDKCYGWNDACRKMARPPSEYIRGPQLSFDSLVYSPENLRHLVAAVGADRVVIGTDFAYDMASTTPLDDVMNTPGLGDAERKAILGGTAARLLRLS